MVIEKQAMASFMHKKPAPVVVVTETAIPPVRTYLTHCPPVATRVRPAKDCTFAGAS
jgi:hypothetical protein